MYITMDSSLGKGEGEVRHIRDPGMRCVTRVSSNLMDLVAVAEVDPVRSKKRRICRISDQPDTTVVS